MNPLLNDPLVNATGVHNKTNKAFLPFGTIDGQVTTQGDHVRRKTFGFIPMTGGESPEGLYLTAIEDTQEKALAYFLLGGVLSELQADIKLQNAITDLDYVLVIGHTLDRKLRAFFFMDKYDKQATVYVPPLVDEYYGTADIIQSILDKGFGFTE